jgi:hypothetical protein
LLNNDKRLFPCSSHSGQQHQEHAICSRASRSFDVSAEHDELLPEECVFCHEFGRASGKVSQRPQCERGGVRLCPVDQTAVERLNTKACQPRDEGENPLHSVCNPFVKMCR